MLRRGFLPFFSGLIVSLLINQVPSFAQVTFTKHIIDDNLEGAYWVVGTDMDRDGDLDLVAAAHYPGIYWYENNGAGYFRRHPVGLFNGVWHVYPVDLDLDSDVDFVAASSYLGEVAWFENVSDSFTEHSVGPLRYAETVFATDFDGDGDPDIVAAGWGESSVAYWENRGGNFVRKDIDNGVSGAHSVFGADFDGDGDIDVVGSGAGTTAWYRNDGRGNFSGPIGLGTEGALCVFAKDIDGNGSQDILSTGRSSGSILFFPNTGSGDFGMQVIEYEFGRSWTVHAADVDGNGTEDVLSGGFYTENHAVAVWFQDGHGNFTQKIVESDFGAVRSVFGGDLDGDGDADVAAVSSDLNQLVWWEVHSNAVQSQITLTSPNGGESWDASFTHEITWTSSGNVGEVKIEFSSDNGNSYQTVVNSSPNTGSYSWLVPNVVSTNCLIRISEAADGSPSDMSDDVFTIVFIPPPTLTLFSPNGGENWLIGTTQDILWTSTGTLTKVKLEFSADNGANWATIVDSTANDGSESWTIPNHVSNQCLVRVSDARDGIPSEASDAVFAIVAPPPTLTLTAPNGGENWLVGTTQDILWTSTGTLTKVKLEFSADNGASWATIVDSTVNDGSESWKIPDNVSSQCLVRILDTADGNPSDVSDHPFQIVESTVSVTNDNLDHSVFDFKLSGSYPNPLRVSVFNAETRIVYQLPLRSHVRLALYDLLGHGVRILADGEREAGVYHVQWDGRDGSGKPAPSGIYIYRFEADSFRSSRQLLLVK